jgi:chemotaxis protein MotA
MIAILGLVIAFGAIVGGYLMEHGNLLVLVQPAELVIIFGAAVGTLIVANPLPTLMRIVGGLIGLLTGGGFSKAVYTENLKMLFELFANARKAGMAKLEEDVDHP